MTHLFLSHSSADDGFVRELRAALSDLGQEVWIDSRQLRGRDPLESEIQAAIEAAAGLAVLVSPAALQSEWVGKELVYGLNVQAERGRAAFPGIPLSLNGTRLGVLQALFKEEPTYIPVSSAPGGATAALHDILVALGLRLPTDRPPLILSASHAEGRLRCLIPRDTMAECWRYGSDVDLQGMQVIARQLEMASVSFLFEAYFCTRASAARQACIRG